MTEPTPDQPPVAPTNPAMPSAPPDEATAARLAALRASRATSASPSAAASPRSPKQSKRSGPAPTRIVAAAASISAGIGLVALMAGAQQDVVVQVNPAPVTVQPASFVVEMTPADGDAGTPTQVEVHGVESAVPAERPAPQARVVAQSEGS